MAKSEEPLSVDDIEARLGIEFPASHRRALLNASDPIHKRTVLLMPEGNECESILKVYEFLRQVEWKGWPSHLLAFATNECGDYFAYDTREKPYRVYYIDPIGTVEESVSECEREGFVFSDFDDWYRHKMASKVEHD
jgi:hypothetical protein